MINNVLKYSIHHDISKEGGVAHCTTNVYADGVHLDSLQSVQITVNTVEFSTVIVGKDGAYPKSEILELHLNFLSGFNVIGVYPDILVTFDGKKVNYLQSFTYGMDMTKEQRLPLVHFAVL